MTHGHQVNSGAHAGDKAESEGNGLSDVQADERQEAPKPLDFPAETWGLEKQQANQPASSMGDGAAIYTKHKGRKSSLVCMCPILDGVFSNSEV